ncbi:MAG: cob(I)yrinic acid a,c-diamide adenosyltransferase [Desulfarculaceae bacterium]|nr:cob(I)yrinic acid a,c-diamide adenosyltransferase [Desulfarculaceae bacterium]
MNSGYIQIYTGDGKGKTTAALGLALRAAGAGYRTFIGQFMKGRHYSELDAVRTIEAIEIEQFGDEDCITADQVDQHRIRLAEAGLDRIYQVFDEKRHSVVVLDEIFVAVWFSLLTEELVMDLVLKKPEQVELVMTGRKAGRKFIEYADLVTEMMEVKHYYTRGVAARKGIEM